MRIITLLFLLISFQLGAQTIQTEFGKNRVQFHRGFDDWSQYESPNFITYWYGKGRNIGQSVVQIAENDFEDIQNLLEHRMNRQIEIIVYTDITDLKQSNIGIEDAFENQSGQTKILGNKMFVYFDGNHLNLRRNIREGIATVFVNSMLFGSNLQEIVQNAVMLNLPNWFKTGLISYCGEAWNTDLDNRLRDVILNERYKSFDKFAEAEPKLAGHSFWHYIGQNFGKSTVSNLLYLTRINRSLESGFLYVLGMPYQSIRGSWALYFKDNYTNEAQEFEVPDGEEIPVKNKHELPLSQLKLSPDGQRIAYVTNEIGRFQVYIQDLTTGKRQRVKKGGFRNAIQATDYDYPLVAWSRNNTQLAIIYEQRDVVKLLMYDTKTKSKVVEPLDPQYQRVHSMDFVDNNRLVLSATVGGFSDVFLYSINTRQTQRITRDFWDDLDARFVQLRNKPGLIFASNRQDSILVPRKLDTILPIQTFDLFYYDLETKTPELVRLTNTPLANEKAPIAVDSTWFSYLSDVSGIYNRSSGYLEDFVAYYEKVILLNAGDEILLHPDSMLSTLDSTEIDTIFIRPIIKQRAVTHFQSNYDQHIVEHHAAPRANKYVFAYFKEGKEQFYVERLNPELKLSPKPSKYMVQRIRQFRQKKKAAKVIQSAVVPEAPEIVIDQKNLSPEKLDTGKVDIDNYLFQSDFDAVEKPEQLAVENEETYVVPREDSPYLKATKENQVLRFRPARITPYRLKFRTDFVTTTLDNNLLFDGLNSYAGTPDEFQLPPPGILFKGNFKDLMEDYEIEGGVRVPTSFNGAEYFLTMSDKKRRWDKKYALYRKTQRFTQGQVSIVPQRSDQQTIIALTQFRYPIDIFQSFRTTATFRMDRLTDLATDATSLSSANFREQRLGLKAEYVYDNTLDVALNVKNGTRMKFYVEAVKRIEVDLGENTKFDLGNGMMGVVGMDARHYIRFWKYSVFASRFAGATTFGSEKILFYLGGVENWMYPFERFSDVTPLPTSSNFAYQTIAANMRGFKMNIRNGNSFALLNTELRMPLLRYLFPRSQSSFFRNFQAVGFFDVGTAWEGLSPFSNDNPLNTIKVPSDGSLGDDPVILTVNYFRDPIVASYGIGARVMLFGYLVRIDYGWGIETRKVQEPQLHIALGLDF